MAARREGAAAGAPAIGFLGTGSYSEYAVRLGAFRRGLHEFGYAEGENVAVEYRWAETLAIYCRRWHATWFVDRSR